MGNVISKSMEEAQYLLDSDIPYASFPESMGEILLRDLHSIVVCGTHGKTTTSSMQAWIAKSLNLQPGYLIGGVPKNFQTSFAKGHGEYFIIEGDEYDTAFFDKVPKFKHYYPQSVILTGVEFDHADIYNSLDDIMQAFKYLLQGLEAQGSEAHPSFLIYHGEDDNIQRLLKDFKKTKNIRCVSYGQGSSDFKIQNVEYFLEFIRWEILHKDQVFYLKSKMSGPHNVLNFTSNFALSLSLGWDIQSVIRAIETFEGVKRRQETLWDKNSILVIEDFAHHPTSVKMTLEGLKSQYGERRLIAVFEPRSATSRRSVFQEDYLKAFDGQADITVLVPPYKKISEF